MKKLALLTALACVGLATAQPYSSWTYRRNISINTTATAGGADVA